jgi:hypothetical protein
VSPRPSKCAKALIGSMSKTHNPFWTAGNPFTISAAASSEIGLEEQRDSRLSTDFVRVVGHNPMPHEIPCRRLHLVLLEELQHAVASDASASRELAMKRIVQRSHSNGLATRE